MSMTITEKILAGAEGKEKIEPGEIVNANIGVIMCHDVTTPPAISMLEERGIDKVFDREKIVVTPDHFQPAKDIKSAELHKRLDEWARRHKIKYYYKLGRAGVCHALLPEQGHIRPGEVIIGGDSHTCTYGAFAAFSTGIGSTDLAAAIATGQLWFKVPASMKFVLNGSLGPGVYSKDTILAVIARIGVDGALYRAMEFDGDGVGFLSMADRFTITNMAIEAGAKNGIFPFDENTKEFADAHSKRPYKVYESDPDAAYCETRTIDLSSLEPVVALPFLPSNVRPVAEVKDYKVDQVVIGSCTNGRIEDLRIAAAILKGKKVAKGVRLIVIPATPTVMMQAISEGIVETFMQAGGAVSTPTCGPCLGGYMGILARGERAVSTTNRNFVGRMGHPESEVVLASPAVAAASALQGRLADPRDL